MRAIAIALSLLVSPIALAEEPPPLDPAFQRELDAFDAGEARTSRLKLRAMDVLLAGGIVSTLTGAGLMATDRYDQGLRIAGGLTLGFGVVNVILGALAIPGNVNALKRFKADRASRSTPAGLFEAKRRAVAAEHADAILFGINLGLDGGYLLAGLTAVLASQLGVDHSDRWLAGGLAVVIQSAFLIGVDTTALLVSNRRHRVLLLSLVPVLDVRPTPTGTQGTVGVAGSF